MKFPIASPATNLKPAANTTHLQVGFVITISFKALQNLEMTEGYGPSDFFIGLGSNLFLSTSGIRKIPIRAKANPMYADIS